jgi:rhodanese-related sulfurtransferase
MLRAAMSLPQQLLRICTAALLLGVALLATRGIPKAVPPDGEVHACSATPSLAENTFPWIDASDARGLLMDPAVMFVDCRPREQYQSGHISGALSLPSDGDLQGAALSQLHSAQTIIAYCDARGGCESSHRLAARLRELGLPDVRILKDGLPAWLSAGYPAESGPCRLCMESTL